MENAWMSAALSDGERAELLLAELSLDEKMAQVNGVFPFDRVAQDMAEISARTPYGIGTVSTLEVRRIRSLEEAAAWQRQVQRIVMANSPHHIPAAFHMEGLCGAFVQDATSFPAGIGRGASFDPALENEIARIVSRQESAVGFTQVLAPVLDVAYDPRMGRTGESYGEDPTLCAAMGTAYAKGLLESTTAGRRTDSIAKHFLGFHTSAGGIHGTHSIVSERTLIEVYGKPFQAAITEGGLNGVMPCYDDINGESPTASKHILHDLLRGDMGFEGVCFGDYGAVGQTHTTLRMEDTLEEAGLRCMTAGMDIEAPDPCGFGEGLQAMFADGRADIRVLDRAVRRVLISKFRMGLFEHPFALDGEALRSTFQHAEDADVTLRSARESLVLLKNDGILPLQGDARRIAVIGPHANHPRKLFGGYTHLCMMESTYAVANSIAGVAGIPGAEGETAVTIPGTLVQSDETPVLDAILARQKPDCASILTELRKARPDCDIRYAYGYPVAGDDASGFPEALALVAWADVVILSLGGKHGTCSLATMGEGVDASDINLPACQERFLREAAKHGKPMVGIHFDGRPISSDAADAYLGALLECWSPAEKGAQAVTEALTGRIDPSGRMPVTTAYCAGQLPMIYNHPNNSSWHQSGSIGFANYVDLPHTPRYCFGHGLSYTTFDYSSLTLDADEIAPDGEVRIAFLLKNTGSRAGTEIPQLYLRDEFACMVRPVKELAGFARVSLAPGETKRITFTVKASQMALLDETLRWKIEHGRNFVEIGASSKDVRLTGCYRVTDDLWIRGRDRAMIAIAEEEKA